MKAGILTFHRAANYGAVLQAYALHAAITKLGIDCEFVDYECEYLHKTHSPLKFFYVKGLKMKLMQLVFFPTKLRKRLLFNKFIYGKLKLGNTRYIGEKQISADKSVSKAYDRFIVGSDQVWNPRLTRLDSVYFLSFVDDSFRKASYAASFGVSNIYDEVSEFMATHLSSFENIAVREKRGAELINSLTDKDAMVVLDPTLLLTADEWRNFCEKPAQSKYIVLYTVDKSQPLVDFAVELSKETGMQVLFINDALRRSSHVKYMSKTTPEEWVGLFANADYVVTNSFHGLAFALNFNKDMCIGLSTEKVNHNSRLTSLLDTLGISYSEKEAVNVLKDKVNWDDINKNLTAEREKSIAFLKGVFS